MSKNQALEDANDGPCSNTMSSIFPASKVRETVLQNKHVGRITSQATTFIHACSSILVQQIITLAADELQQQQNKSDAHENPERSDHDNMMLPLPSTSDHDLRKTCSEKQMKNYECVQLDHIKSSVEQLCGGENNHSFLLKSINCVDEVTQKKKYKATRKRERPAATTSAKLVDNGKTDLSSSRSDLYEQTAKQQKMESTGTGKDGSALSVPGKIASEVGLNRDTLREAVSLTEGVSKRITGIEEDEDDYD